MTTRAAHRSFMFRKRAGVLACALLAATGCGLPRGERTGAARTSPGADAPPAGAAGRRAFRIAMIAKSSTNPVFLSARAGAEAAAGDQSVRLGFPVQVVWMTPPREDASAQAQRIDQAVKEGMDAILVSCSDEDLLTPAIDDAVAKGVPVMTFDSDAPRSKRFAYFGVDDRRLGAMVMTELAKLMRGRGKIAILAGNYSAPNLRKRAEGVREEAARRQIDVIGTYYHPETPEDAVAEVLRVTAAYPELRGWAMIGGWALFSKTLLDEPSIKQTKIVAVDGLPPELRFVVKDVVPVLIAQPTFLWGNVGVTKILDRVWYHKDVPASIPMEPVKITVESLGDWSRQLKQWGFADVPEEYLRLK